MQQENKKTASKKPRRSQKSDIGKCRGGARLRPQPSCDHTVPWMVKGNDDPRTRIAVV